MKIKETENFIIFENVRKDNIRFFKKIPYKLLFLEGTISDNFYKVDFSAEDIELKDFNNEEATKEDIEVSFTLYYIKQENK